MPLPGSLPIELHYGQAGSKDLLGNLSGAAAIGEALWTVSDEGRSIECLVRRGSGFELHRQLAVDDLDLSIPGADDADGKPPELDLESIDIADGVLWLCGSHCRVRADTSDGSVSSKLKTRRSRRVLAALTLSASGLDVTGARALPFEGAGSLRRTLRDDPFLAPFLDLPSKENGFDIEGIAADGDSLLLGLRGPVIDGNAVVVRLNLDDGPAIRDYELCFLDVGGLGVRDLVRGPSSLYVLAGPMGEPSSPFRLYDWTPVSSATPQKPVELLAFSNGAEKPEGACQLTRDGKPGLLILYDNAEDRIRGTSYVADWIALP